MNIHWRERWEQRSALHALGFSAYEASRLVAIKQRYIHGEFQRCEFDSHLLFARWLVEHGQLTESVPAEGQTVDRSSMSA